eukprot:CAMPEP_0172757306 /NCGR_PEP_ID=MMETSP1074-20121228/163522_1 /TAXON_ID=2916 /ORGANISM="Ceratium fusus, Strain PA161109" /LENGTH=81 /DNA_ID=CAMNT_0013590711 /DNA_START=282 /DNA_END=527 /DNA_ORIENTATION=-
MCSSFDAYSKTLASLAIAASTNDRPSCTFAGKDVAQGLIAAMTMSRSSVISCDAQFRTSPTQSPLTVCSTNSLSGPSSSEV